jgi:hypothetical protein
MKHKRMTKHSHILIGAILAIQSLPLVGGPSEIGSSPEIVDISVEEGKVKISINLNEPFRWENTRYESIKIFPLPWGGALPHEIWFKEKGDMTWRQTDMMFMGNYTELDEYEVEAGVMGFLLEIIGIFNPETNLLNFDTLDYIPFYQVPKLIIEESKDLKNWSRIKLSEPLPKEYQRPEELTIKLGAALRSTSFFRVRLEE